MTAHVFLILAVLVGLALVALANWRALASAEPLDADLPPTLLQRQARLGLGILTALLVAVVGVVYSAGPALWFELRPLRMAVLGLMIVGMGAYAAMIRTTRSAAGDEGRPDERDRTVLARAHMVQATALMTALTVQTLAVTEFYWDSGSLPISIPYMVFLVSFLVYCAAHPLGILLGYRAINHAQG